jgi:hypothetical protein
LKLFAVYTLTLKQDSIQHTYRYNLKHRFGEMKMATKSRKSVFDMKHVSSVHAWALLIDGEMAGRIVCNMSDNPAGSVFTVQVGAWKGPLNSSDGPMIGSAGGCGYCKFSAAFAQAIAKHCKANSIDDSRVSGCGSSAMVAFLERLGYKVCEVI